MFRRSAFSLLCAAIALTAAASAKPAAPIASTIHLTGTYACTGSPQAESHAWTSMLGGAWLSGDAGHVDNLVSHDARAHVYHVASLDTNGGLTVFQAPDTSSTHIVFKAVYPATVNQTTTYDWVSSKQYRLTFDGSAHGKPFHDVLTCTKK